MPCYQLKKIDINLLWKLLYYITFKMNTDCEKNDKDSTPKHFKFIKILRLIGLVCVCATVGATVYFTTDRVLTHIENSANRVNPVPNESQESEPVLVDIPIPTTTPVDNITVPLPTSTPVDNIIVPLHPRDLGVIARIGDTGLYGSCCFDDRDCQDQGCRCIGIEPNWTMSDLEVEEEVICIRKNGIWQNRWGWSGSRQMDPLDQFVELVMEECAFYGSIMMMDSVLGGGTYAGDRMREIGWMAPANWVPIYGGVYEFRIKMFNGTIPGADPDTPDRGWHSLQALRMPKPGEYSGLSNGTHVMSLYLPYWKRRFVRMFKDMPKNTHKQSCVEMMRAHICG